MPNVACLYLDDSGTRNPDKKPNATQFRDWFAIGGIYINEENEDGARKQHEKFCAAWGITYPLHSSEIRSREKNFAWLGKLDAQEERRFYDELTAFVLDVPAIGFACVIDRPGYDARYREKYGRNTWMLCRTAFAVVSERAAKRAIGDKRKLRVFAEKSDKKTDRNVRSYYEDLRNTGMPFASDNSSRYGPLSPAQLKETLYDLKFKSKDSAMEQIADLFLYPIARGGYEADYRPYQGLKSANRLIDCLITAEELPSLGVKYSCFDK